MNNLLLPIGSSCRVRQSIDRFYNNKQITNLFDWVSSDFNAVLYFIKNIDTKILESDFYDTGCIENLAGNRIVTNIHTYFVSVHDCHISKTYEEILPVFITMLNRRLNRLKNTIIHNNKIDFIHLLNMFPRIFVDTLTNLPTDSIIEDFIYNIYKINNNLDFTLHLLVPPGYYEDNINLFIPLHKIENNQSSNITQTKGKLRIHIMSLDYESLDDIHVCKHWSWNSIYKIITNNIIPNDFNIYYYKKLNIDLQHMKDDELVNHYINHGMNEYRKYRWCDSL